jgi:hypothetical protein
MASRSRRPVTISKPLAEISRMRQYLMRVYLLAVLMIVLAGCSDQVPKMPSGEVAKASASPESGGAAPEPRQRNSGARRLQELCDAPHFRRAIHLLESWIGRREIAPINAAPGSRSGGRPRGSQRGSGRSATPTRLRARSVGPPFRHFIQTPHSVRTSRRSCAQLAAQVELRGSIRSSANSYHDAAKAPAITRLVKAVLHAAGRSEAT